MLYIKGQKVIITNEKNILFNKTFTIHNKCDCCCSCNRYYFRGGGFAEEWEFRSYSSKKLEDWL